MNFQPDFSLILAVSIALLAFGIGYNALIGWMERHKYLEGYTAFAVALGVLVTLGGVAIVNWGSALLALGAFVLAGSPMVFGSVARYAKARKQEQLYERQAATLAEHSRRD